MQTDLNLLQLKIFTKIIMSTIKNPDDDFYRFSIKNLMDEFNLTDTNYTNLKRATKEMNKVVVLKTQNGEDQLALFTKVSYNGGIVDMYLHPELKPYILDIKQRYTKYFFKNIT
jgi:plasmid replication initiation protein